MSIFEFVFGLFSVIISLGIAHLLGGVAELVRSRARVKFSLAQALWMWSAFCVTVGNWAGMWALRLVPSWPPWSVLLMIMMSANCYFICYFVTPNGRADATIDLADFYQREHRNYLSAFVVLSILALVANPLFGSTGTYMAWVRNSALSLAALAFVLLPLLLKARWARLAGAVATALLGAFFIVASTNIVTG